MYNQIIGLVLVKNEDLFIKYVIENIVEFCDKIIVLDNESTDKTYEILMSLKKKHNKIELHKIKDVSKSQDYISKYVGSKTWIFGVDGDEIYDPSGLKIMRQKILDGNFDSDWIVFGNVLNIVKIDYKNKKVKGYLAPPCRSMTKLYNFSAISKWDQTTERLHGQNILFKKGYNKELRRHLYKEMDWDVSYFRCLHAVLQQRSSIEKYRISTNRFTPSQALANDKASLRMKVKKFIIKTFVKNYKVEKYKRGECVEKDMTAFFPDL